MDNGYGRNGIIEDKHMQMEIEISELTVNPNKKVSNADFEKLKVLGKGGYGKVYLVKKKDRGSRPDKILALKELKKARLTYDKDRDHTLTERQVLERLKHPFIVKLFYAFQTDSTLSLVMEYCAGGELFRRMEENTLFSSEEACFYMCEVILAIGHLHSLGIIYRDLKPENILLDRDGHVKLTDFGLSKEGVERTHTFCGTMDYMAPEIIKKLGHDKSVDWWSSGALLCDMLTGGPPFSQDGDKEKTKERILSGKLSFTKNVPPVERHLIKSLLQLDPYERLGYGPNDVEDIKGHNFFRDNNVHWESVLQRRVQPPYIPQLNSETDVSEFDPRFTNEPPVGTPDDTTASHEHFLGFSYSASLNSEPEQLLEELRAGGGCRSRHGRPVCNTRSSVLSATGEEDDDADEHANSISVPNNRRPSVGHPIDLLLNGGSKQHQSLSPSNHHHLNGYTTPTILTNTTKQQTAVKSGGGLHRTQTTSGLVLLDPEDDCYMAKHHHQRNDPTYSMPTGLDAILGEDTFIKTDKEKCTVM